MYKKTLKYTNFNGDEVEKEFYFYLSEAELTEMRFSTAGGLEKYIDRIVKEKDQKKMIEIFKDILIKAHGIKSDDGEHFYKNAQVTEEFVSTQAFSDLYMLFVTNDEEAAAFINGIMPKKIAREMNKQS